MNESVLRTSHHKQRQQLKQCCCCFQMQHNMFSAFVLIISQILLRLLSHTQLLHLIDQRAIKGDVAVSVGNHTV
jgi:hypothetical protein